MNTTELREKAERLEKVIEEIDNDTTMNEFPQRRYLSAITRLIHTYQKIHGFKPTNTPEAFWNSIEKIAKKNKADSKRLERLADLYSNTVNEHCEC